MDRFVLADHGVGVINLCVNTLRRLVGRVWRSTRVVELEGRPVIFAGHAVAVCFFDHIEETARKERDVCQLDVVGGRVFLLFLQQT